MNLQMYTKCVIEIYLMKLYSTFFKFGPPSKSYSFLKNGMIVGIKLQMALR